MWIMRVYPSKNKHSSCMHTRTAMTINPELLPSRTWSWDHEAIKAERKAHSTEEFCQMTERWEFLLWFKTDVSTDIHVIYLMPFPKARQLQRQERLHWLALAVSLLEGWCLNANDLFGLISVWYLFMANIAIQY